MQVDGIRELFEPAGPIALRRMFGGHGIYRDGRIVALSVDGGIWLKTDALSRPAFESAGSRPFTYAKSTGVTVALSYWALPEEAFDDPDSLRRWVRLAEAAADRVAENPPAKRRRGKS